MNRLIRVTCLMAVLLPMQISAQGTGSNPDNRALRENLAAAAAWDEAFNSENLAGVMQLYADRAVSAPPGLPNLIGKPAIQADYEFLFANFDFHHETTVVQLEIHGTMAVERGEYTMVVEPADGSPAFLETGKHMIVRRQFNGSWKVVMETWNVD